MDKIPSPWSTEFRETSTVARVGPDEIQHRGNKNSGLYKGGSHGNSQTATEKKDDAKGG